jgi:hypothetical protein
MVAMTPGFSRKTSEAADHAKKPIALGRHFIYQANRLHNGGQIAVLREEPPMPQSSRNWFICKCLTIALALHMASCGTLIYPERRGQPPGYLDAGVVALDAVGLLLFFVPGVIAFAVDFTTGAIYLPPAPPYYGASSQPPRVLHVDPAELTSRRLETILAQETGEPVNLKPGSYRATRLNQIEDFTPNAVSRIQAAPVSSNVIFRGSSE